MITENAEGDAEVHARRLVKGLGQRWNCIRDFLASLFFLFLLGIIFESSVIPDYVLSLIQILLAGTDQNPAAFCWSTAAAASIKEPIHDVITVHPYRPHCTRQIGTAIAVWANCYDIVDAAIPFGGHKMNGQGREKGIYSLSN